MALFQIQELHKKQTVIDINKSKSGLDEKLYKRKVHHFHKCIITTNQEKINIILQKAQCTLPLRGF